MTQADKLLKLAEDFEKRAQQAPAGMQWIVKDDVRQLVPANIPAGMHWTVKDDVRQLAPNSWTGSAIDPIVQKMLGVAPDGKLGPKTTAALGRYKATINNPTMTDAMAIASLKKRPEYLSQTEMKYDDNTNRYV